MKKILIICFLLVIISSGCSLQSTKPKNNNSDNKNLLKKDDYGSDIFVDKKYREPVVMTLEEFEQNCPKQFQNNRNCNKTIMEKIGCVDTDALDMYFDEKKGFYTCYSNKEESSTLTDNNSIYLLVGTNTITTYYNWDDFVFDLQPIIDSENKALSIISLAGFSASLNTEKQIKKVDSNYLISDVNYDYDFYKICMGSHWYDNTYKRITADIIVQPNGIIKMSQKKQIVKADCFVVDEKPIIYLYPEVETDVIVKLDYDGEIVADYPTYNKNISGWQVTAFPDGRLINKEDGEEYNYLFWEGISNNQINYNLSRGFVVKGEDTKNFLQTTLAEFGLTPKEYNEFIVYWYPKMKDNKYNLIHFAGEEYTDSAKLIIAPKPDSILRVFMVFKPLDKFISILPQTIPDFQRNGFVVIEWGGAEIK